MQSKPELNTTSLKLLRSVCYSNQRLAKCGPQAPCSPHRSCLMNVLCFSRETGCGWEWQTQEQSPQVLICQVQGSTNNPIQDEIMLQKNSVSHPLPGQLPQKCQSAYHKIKSTIWNGTRDISLAAFHSPRGNHSPFSVYVISDIQRIPWAEWDMHVIPAFRGWHKRSTKSEVILGFLKKTMSQF